MADADITDRLRQEFRVRDWWPGMDSFDSARGETVPHPVAREAAAEIERLRAALQAIVEFQPDREELGEEFGAEVAACEQCEVWRRKQHPIQRMCETHVRRTFAVRDSNAQSAAYQHYTLRDIARRALDSGRTVTPLSPSQNGSTTPTSGAQ